MVDVGSVSSLNTASWDSLISLSIISLAFWGMISWIAWGGEKEENEKDKEKEKEEEEMTHVQRS